MLQVRHRVTSKGVDILYGGQTMSKNGSSQKISKRELGTGLFEFTNFELT